MTRSSLLVATCFIVVQLSSAQFSTDTLLATVAYQDRLYIAPKIPVQSAEMAQAVPGVPDLPGSTNPYKPGHATQASGTTRHSALDTASFSWYQVPGAMPVVYQVRPKETVFRIARRYFHMPIEALMMMNNLTTTDLKIGQYLLVGWYKAPTGTTKDSTAVAHEVDSDPFEGEAPVYTRGKGFWDKTYPDEGHLFAMHRTARINSRIELINPMFDRKIMVKVIGRVPNTFRRDVDVIVSPAVAKKLGVIDPRFYVHMRFVE